MRATVVTEPGLRDRGTDARVRIDANRQNDLLAAVVARKVQAQLRRLPIGPAEHAAARRRSSVRVLHKAGPAKKAQAVAPSIAGE